MLVIAYPQKDKANTRLKFSYGVVAEAKSGDSSPGGNTDNSNDQSTGDQQKDKDKSDEPKDGGSPAPVEEENDTLFIILCVGAAVLLIIIIVVCVVFNRYRNQDKIRQGQHYPQKDKTLGESRTLELGNLGDYEINHTKQPAMVTHGDSEFDKME